MLGRGARRSAAFAPAHVTGLFVPSAAAENLAGVGSRGAGLVLELGVTAVATFRPGGARRTEVRAEGPRRLPISLTAACRLAPAEPGLLTVELHHDLPIGQGFGMSAAGALATALAVARLSKQSRSAAIRVAHESDLLGGGGLGGVAAILGGGLELRRTPGLPPIGRIEHRPFPQPVWIGVVGRPISTRSALADPRLRRRIEAAAPTLDRLFRAPSPERFLSESEQFTDRVALASRPLRDALRALRRRGAFAAQAMFGESFFAVSRSARHRDALARWLARSPVRAVELRCARHGAIARAQPF